MIYVHMENKFSNSYHILVPDYSELASLTNEPPPDILQVEASVAENSSYELLTLSWMDHLNQFSVQLFPQPHRNYGFLTLNYREK